ncbi:NAD(P)-dependent oxidoreductase [Nonomuraea salmonea]|uniref:NAD(P)-dependent oxidoreductase n=1 Tax=Nonomuraea salmonea TaxID=46181 RepID=UPI0031E8E9AB
MKILVFGATGMVGQRIAAELRDRGHEVTGVSRSGGPVKGDVRDTATLAPRPRRRRLRRRPAARRHRARAAVHRGQHGAHRRPARGRGAPADRGRRRRQPPGGPPGQDLVDTPEFPELYKKEALAGRALLRFYREVDDLDWTFVSPAAEIAPGERTGVFRVGGDTLLSDEQGRSFISAEDYAVAIADELEKNANVRKRICVAY